MTKVTVVMSANNRPDFLDKTINSVLNQSLKDFEFLIVDDGARKEVKKKLKQFKSKDKRIKIITNKKNIGLTRSLNRALRRAKGKYVARIDNGDNCNRHRLKKQYKFMEKHKRVGLSGAFINIINENGKKIGEITYPKTDKKIREALLRANMFTHSTLIMRKSVLDTLGYYDEDFFYSQDYELIFRIGSKHKLANLPEYLVDYVYDPNGITVSPKKRKKQDGFAIKARRYALTRYGYSWKGAPDFMLAFVESQIPFKVKKLLINLKKKDKDLKINVKGKKISFTKEAKL